MAKIFALAFVLASLCVAAYGHGWMVKPTPANFQGDTQASASQDKPCGFGVGPGSVTLPKYGNIDSTFSIGGGHNTAPCTVALATSANETAFDQNIMWQWECRSPSSHEKSFFITKEPGTYYMRWRWSGWLACAQVTVTAPEVSVSPMNVGEQKTGNIAAADKEYYELSIEPNKFVLLEFNGPADTTFGASQNQLPTAASADVLVSSSGDGSLCSSSEYSTAIVAAFGGSSTGSYSITANTYNGILDYVNDPDQDMSVSKATTRIFATDAFDNTKSTKRIVVRRTGGSGDVGITAMGTDCSASVSQPQSFGSNACVSVGTNQDRKYYKVYTTGAADFTVKVEDGTCSTVSMGVANNISLLFLVASFIVALF